MQLYGLFSTNKPCPMQQEMNRMCYADDTDGCFGIVTTAYNYISLHNLNS